MIRLAIQRPVGVLVGLLLVLLFGALSISDLPIQLTPDVSIPTITVTTTWPGAAPAEVEQELLLEQEEVLKSVAGLDRMVGTATDSTATLTLEFDVGTSMDESLVRVSNQLAQISTRPETAREPVLATADTAGPPLAVLTITGRADRDPIAARTWVLESIIPQFERIPGIASVRMFGGRDTEVQVRFAPEALAARGVEVGELIAAVQAGLVDVSAGDVELGKRRFIVRTEVAPERTEALDDIVVKVFPDGTVLRLGDVGHATIGLRKASRYVINNGKPSLALLFDRESGANVLEVTEAVIAEAERLDADVMASRGLEIQVVSDQRAYIRGALDLVRSNLLVGGALAVGVLMLFLRSVSASAIVATAIPASIIGTILGMSLLGRSINVVSLAGMAFAVGMVVDNAIVVIENIDTWRQKGVSAAEAAYEGTREVWGALIASTATTAAVFMPIVAWQDEVGELLRDVAVAITVAVMLSFVVSVLVIPSASARVTQPPKNPNPGRFDRWAGRQRNRLVSGVRSIVDSPRKSLATVGLALGLSGTVGATLIPPMEYLPTGNRNFMFAVVVPPTGYGVEEMYSIGKSVQAQLKPHFGENPTGTPALHRSFFVALPGQGFMGAGAQNPEDIGAVVGLVNRTLGSIPGVMGFGSQASLFGRSLSSGRGVSVELSGADTPTLVAAGKLVMGKIQDAIPGAKVRPTPALDLGGPELRVLPRRDVAAQLGLNAADIGTAVDVFVDGRIVGEFAPAGNARLDVVVVAEPSVMSTSDLLTTPISTPLGGTVPLASITDVVETLSPTTIQRIERRRALTLEVTPPDNIAIEEALSIIRGDVLANITLPDSMAVTMSGAGGKLEEAQVRMLSVLGLATVISFLLLAALFEDFLGPLVILVTVPLAGAGGVLGLRLVDTFLSPQPLDMLSALGFVILIGVVVNNAILIVDGALARLRDGQGLTDATTEAVAGRVRPIFMASLTSLAGLLPLVLFPGSGSELYRGVGAIVLGGLTLSTALSLVVVPALFALVWRLRGVR